MLILSVSLVQFFDRVLMLSQRLYSLQVIPSPQLFMLYLKMSTNTAMKEICLFDYLLFVFMVWLT